MALAETNLEYPGNLFGVRTVHVCLSDGPHVEEFAEGEGGGHRGLMFYVQTDVLY